MSVASQDKKLKEWKYVEGRQMLSVKEKCKNGGSHIENKLSLKSKAIEEEKKERTLKK